MPPLAKDHASETTPGLRTYTIDPQHARANFRIQYFGIGNVTGVFPRCEGTIRFDPADPASIAVSARIDAAGIDTGNRDRDRQLRGKDLFDVKNYPHLRFISTGAAHGDGDHFELSGDLTVRDITKSVVLRTHFLGFGRDEDGRLHVGFSAEVTLLRSEFAVRWKSILEAGGALIGDRVDVTLHIQAYEADNG